MTFTDPISMARFLCKYVGSDAKIAAHVREEFDVVMSAARVREIREATDANHIPKAAAKANSDKVMGELARAERDALLGSAALKKALEAYYERNAELMASVRRRFTSGDIIAAVCKATCLSADDVKGQVRDKYLARARQAAAYLMRERRPDLSWTQMALVLGGRDHSTIIYNVRRAEELLGQDEAFAALVRKAEALL